MPLIFNGHLNLGRWVIMKYLLVLLLVFSFSQPLFAGPRQLQFGLVDIYPLANIKDGVLDQTKPGIIIELLGLLAKRLPIEVSYKPCPVKRCFVMLAQGQIDAMPAVSYSLERAEKYAVYPLKDGQADIQLKIFDGAYSLYVLKGSSLKWDGENMMGQDNPVGVNLGFSAATFLKEKGITILENNSTQANMNMLVAKRLSAVATVQFLADVLIQKNNQYRNIIKMAVPLKSKPYFTVFSRQFFAEHPQLAQQYWIMIAQLRDSKEFSEIVSRYID